MIFSDFTTLKNDVLNKQIPDADRENLDVLPSTTYEALKHTTQKPNPENTSFLQNVVTTFKKALMPLFFAGYLPGYTVDMNPEANQAQVQTIIADADLDKLDPKSTYRKNFAVNAKKVQNFLKPSYQAAAERPEYYDWLDFSNGGVVRTNVAEAESMAQNVKNENFKNAVVMGMGGSSMCGKLINSFFDTKEDFGSIKMLDNMDPKTINDTLDQANYQKGETAFVFISKSGGTFEVAHAIQTVLDILKKDDPDNYLQRFAKQAVFITEAKEYNIHTLEDVSTGKNSGTLNQLIEELKVKTGIEPKVITHPARIGGRFSLFSAVGMFIASLKGLNTQEILAGAQDALKEFFDTEDPTKSSAYRYALIDTLAALQTNKAFAARYVMPYTDRLNAVPEFMGQLAGESNNKNGMRSLNQISGRGPTAHHSDVEALCRNDARRLLFEQILVNDIGKDDHVHDRHDLDSLREYNLKSMHQENMTKLALPFARHLQTKKGNPVISTVLESLNERNFGYLMMRNMLATVIQSGIQIYDDKTVAENLDQAIRQAEVEDFKKAKKADLQEVQDGALEGLELAV
jgi:glucose-6-phosphate isomerase